MNIIKSVEIYCPNCGGSAERHYLTFDQIVRTQCAHCDYLMITCDLTGNVIEAYAPGYSAVIREGVRAEARSCPQAASASSPRE